MIDSELTDALRDLESQYTQKPITKKWNDPTREEMIVSLNKAHSVNKALIRNLNTVLKNLAKSDKSVKRLMIAFGATWASVLFLLKWLIPYAIKGMIVHP